MNSKEPGSLRFAFIATLEYTPAWRNADETSTIFATVAIRLVGTWGQGAEPLGEKGRKRPPPPAPPPSGTSLRQGDGRSRAALSARPAVCVPRCFTPPQPLRGRSSRARGGTGTPPPSPLPAPQAASQPPSRFAALNDLPPFASWGEERRGGGSAVSRRFDPEGIAALSPAVEDSGMRVSASLSTLEGCQNLRPRWGRGNLGSRTPGLPESTRG